MPPKKQPAAKATPKQAPAGKKASTPPQQDAAPKPPTPPPKQLWLEREKRIFCQFHPSALQAVAQFIVSERDGVVGTSQPSASPSEGEANTGTLISSSPATCIAASIKSSSRSLLQCLAIVQRDRVSTAGYPKPKKPEPSPKKTPSAAATNSSLPTPKKSTPAKTSARSPSPQAGPNKAKPTATADSTAKDDVEATTAADKDPASSPKGNNKANVRWTQNKEPKKTKSQQPSVPGVSAQPQALTSKQRLPLLSTLQENSSAMAFPLLHGLCAIVEMSNAENNAIPPQQQASHQKTPKAKRVAKPTPMSPAAMSGSNESNPTSPTHRSGGDRSPRNRAASPPVNPEMNESQRRVQDQQRKTQEMRESRRRREQERMERELALAREATARAKEREEEERAAKERALQERLQQLREKREARELEFLVGERRAQQVLHSKNLFDLMQERFEAEQQIENEKREEALKERRAKIRAPVVVGLEEAERRLQEVVERKKKRDDELKANWEALAKGQHKHHQGSSYGMAVEEHIKLKHKFDDEKHSRLYRHAKMQEYGNLVKRLQEPTTAWENNPDLALGDDAPSYQQRAPSTKTKDEDCLFEASLLTSIRRRRTKRANSEANVFDDSSNNGELKMAHHDAPFMTGNTPFQHRVTTTVPKESLTQAERTKHGNLFLKEAIKAKDTPLPPGLKLAPLADIKREQEYKRFKDRKVKGDQYLRDLRQVTCAQTPQPNGRKFITDQEYLDELKKIRVKATSKEHHLLENLPDLDDAEECYEYNEQYLEVIQMKMDLLRRCQGNNKSAA